MISTIDLLGRLRIFQQYLILYIQNWLSPKNILNVPIVNRCMPFNVNIQQCLLKQAVSTYLAWVMISLAIVIMLQLAGMQPISWVASCTAMTVEIRFLRDSQRLRRPATILILIRKNCLFCLYKLYIEEYKIEILVEM